MTDIKALIERLEAADGPDRGIDRALAFHILGEGVEKERKLYAEIGDAMWVPDARGLSPYDRARGDTIRSEWQKGSRRQPGRYVDVRWYACDGPRPLTDCKPLTASLDAAVAFAERVLPGCYVRTEPRFHIDGERVDFVSWALRPRWSDWRPDDEWFDRGEGRHAKQVLSILIAVLRAMEGGRDAD